MKAPAMFSKALDDNAVSCFLCAQHCKIAEGETGFCGVRVNQGGRLYTLAYGETVARSVDPIEKKPLYLIIPGGNDSEDDLSGIAGFLAGVDPEIPWHISRFHPDYAFDSTPPTPLASIETAERIGREAGLHFIYPGNVPDSRDTLCPDCGDKAVVRSRGGVQRNNLRDGRCPSCGEVLAGVWS
jgi:DNA-directed RNA polymerase subunit RPC12/RpoP